MKSILTIALLVIFTLNGFSKVIREEITLHFKSNHFELTEGDKSQLDDFLNWTEFRGDYVFYIGGHTDQDGTYAFNEALSRKRSEEVRDYLLARGASDKCLRITHYGERDLLFEEDDDSYKQKNRRVTVEYNRYEFEDVSELQLEMARRNLNTFEINSQENQLVTTARGIELRMEPQSFVRADGTLVEGEVLIDVRDALDLMAFLSEGLSTMSGGEVLETGGMLKIEARARDGELLELAPGKQITVLVPNPSLQPGMELYYSEDGKDWANSETAVLAPSSDFSIRPMRPFKTFPRFNGKPFRPDLSTKPRRPYEPSYPDEPIAPSQADYEIYYRTYKGSKKKKTQFADARFAKEKRKYAKQMMKYEHRLMKVKKLCENFYVANNNFETVLASWEADQLKALERHNAEVIPAMREVYQEKYKYQLQAFNIEMENYWEEYNAWSMESAGRMAATNEAGNYLFSTSELNWLNIDRKVNESERTGLIVMSDRDYNEKLCLIEEKGRTAVTLYAQTPGKYSVTVSKKKKAVLVAYRVVDGQLYSCVEEVKGKERVEVEYRPVTYLELKETLEGLTS